jgi:hypothetical protein
LKRKSVENKKRGNNAVIRPLAKCTQTDARYCIKADSHAVVKVLQAKQLEELLAVVEDQKRQEIPFHQLR